MIAPGPRRGWRPAAFALLAALCFLGGCESEATVEANEFPNVASVRITIAGRTVNVDALGAESGGPAIVRVNSTVPVVASFHMPSGVVDPLVTTETFQLNLEHIAGSPLTFTRSETNLVSGTLTSTNMTGGSSLRMSLHNHKTGATQFGPYNITIAITQ
jgi:hypothetical protein